jgi:hypothetical protein
LSGVLAYKTYGDNVVLYATDDGATSGRALVKVLQNNATYTLRSVGIGSTYLLDIIRYSGEWYAACGAPGDNKVYVYKDPAGALRAAPDDPLVPIQILKVTSPNHVSFSGNARFIVAEHDTEFYVYDILNDNGYRYKTGSPLDVPQDHAVWMDGFRLAYVSGGRLAVFDYDDVNEVTLMPASAQFAPFFSQDYRYVYAIAPIKNSAGSGTHAELTNTALRTAADL